MGLFGGGGGSSTKISRPDYIQNMINNLSGQINGINVGDYNNLQYAGLNKDQQEALNQMMNNPQMQDFANSLVSQGEEGLGNLDNVYKQVSDYYSNPQYTAEGLDKLTSQLYNRGDVENAINASNQASERQYSTETAPNVAQQTNLSGGFGSAQRLGQARAQEALVNEEQSNADNIAQNAYQNAQNQALAIQNANTSNTRAALGALTTNAQNQAGLVGAGASLGQQLADQSAAAVNQSLSNRQNEMNNAYTNSQNANAWQYQDVQNRINAASVFNGALGQTTKTTSSGGGAGILGGAMSGAAAGSAFG